MSEMKLKIHNKKCEVLAASIPGEETSLVYTAPYADGDFILLETDEDCCFCVIQMDDAMLPALVYTPGPRMAFHIPAPELRSCYSPKCFSGSCHLIRARAAKPEEISARRNLAFNPTIMYGRLAASRTSFPVSKRRARISLPETPWTAFLKTIPTAAGHIRHGASTKIPVQR